MSLYKTLNFLVGFVLLAIVAMADQKDIKETKNQSDLVITPKELAREITNLLPKGWEIFDDIKHFKAENLYEQINGRAEYYLAYDVIGMTYAIFDKSTDNNMSIYLSIYDMGTPTNAFGVFSGERSMDSQRLNFGRDAYCSGANYYIWKGQYYIQIVTTDTTNESKQIGMVLAEKLVDFLQDTAEPVWGLNVLPKKDRVPQSVRYFLVDALGLDFLRNTYTAKYYKKEQEVSVFLSCLDSPEQAKTIISQYTEYVTDYGKGINFQTIDSIELVSCDMGKSYDVIFQKGRLVAGVTDVRDKSLAVEVALDFWKQLKHE